MVKTIIKEIGIGVLLLIAIVLVLGIIFYDYIPNNKTVPIKIQAYNMPEDIKEDLDKAIPDEQKIIKTYSIDNADLDTYEATNDYDKGKPNPFAAYGEEIQESLSESEGNNNTENTQQENTNKNEVYITTPGKNYWYYLF